MSEPMVACILLTSDRPEMTRQAVASFHAQTYANKRLIVYDSGTEEYPYRYEVRQLEWAAYYWDNPIPRHTSTIGELRNNAIRMAVAGPCDLIAHFDSDDQSHPWRLFEQVALLQSSGAQITGYNQVPFWRTETQDCWMYTDHRKTYAIGASLMYRREFWEKHPFPPLPRVKGGHGEDNAFLSFARDPKDIASVSSVIGGAPRLVCRIHPGQNGNSQDYSAIDNPLVQQTSFTRAPEWDDYCRRAFSEPRVITGTAGLVMNRLRAKT